MKRSAFFPGTFDPFTIGHESIVRRSMALFDEIIIGVGINEHKRCLQTPIQRIESIRKLYADNPRVRVEGYSNLTTDFARSMNAECILRGVRSLKDFEYERDIADVNRRLTGIETVILLTEPELVCVSSSVIRELIHFGKDVSSFLPKGYQLPQINNNE